MENVAIQILDGYNWLSVSLVANDPQRVNLEMVAVKSRYPDRRVRAVLQDGKLIDIL